MVKQNPFIASLAKIMIKAINHQKGYNRNMPLYEETLQVFMPGDKIQFVERWCTATFVSFLYFTRKDSRVNRRRPLFKIDLCDIRTVKKTNIFRNDKDGKKCYYFEIILKNELGYDPFNKHGGSSSGSIDRVSGSKFSKRTGDSSKKLTLGDSSSKKYPTLDKLIP